MALLYVLAVLTFFAIFVLFLVLSKTLNNIMNNLIKLQYLLQKELDFKKEQLAINSILEEEKAKAKVVENVPEAEPASIPPANGKTKK